MTPFALDPALAEETIALRDWPLSRVLLRDDARFAWLILVPRRPGLTEFHDLAPEEAGLLAAEIAAASRALKSVAGADKINIGALGNIVRQLHVHIIARRAGDPAWPGPVWGFGVREAMAEAQRTTLAARLGAALS